MELKKGELRVFFNAKNMRSKKREIIESRIERLLKRLGYNQWASGMDMVSRTRELAFDKQPKSNKITGFIETKDKITAIVK